MAEKDSEKGYGHGSTGQPNQNPDNRGVLSSVFDTLVDVGSGNLGNVKQTNDQNSKDYNDSYDAGKRDYENSKK